MLEVGCGTGLNFRHLLRPLDPDRGRLVGLDFSADMLRQAAKRVEACGYRNVQLVQGDATCMDLGEKFDGILLAYSLTMIPDWKAALERARAHLKPEGRLVVLDFGKFEGWGFLGGLPRGWLRMNHVEVRRPYLDAMDAMFEPLQVHRWFGGYNFTAVGEATCTR